MPYWYHWIGRAVVMLIGASLVLLPAQPVAACSLARPTVAIYTQDSDVIAIGTLIAATDEVVTLQVEQYLKGHEQAPSLAIANHTMSVAPDCGVTVAGGRRWPVGARVLAFLQRKQVYGQPAVWPPVGWLSDALFVIQGDALRSVARSVTYPFGSLLRAQAEIAAVAGPPHRPVAPPSLPRDVLLFSALIALLVTLWFRLPRQHRAEG